MTRGSGWFLRLRLGRHILRRRHSDDATRDAASRHTTTNYQVPACLALLFAQLKPAKQPKGPHKRLKAFSGCKARRCLNKVSFHRWARARRSRCTLGSAVHSFRWPASNDSEAVGDAVATMVPSLYSSQPNDSQFKFRNEPRKRRLAVPCSWSRFGLVSALALGALCPSASSLRWCHARRGLRHTTTNCQLASLYYLLN